MAGISAQERRERKAGEALDKIRDALPEIAEQLLQAGLGGTAVFFCKKCKEKNEVKVKSDPKILLSLWERVEGKPQEAPRPSEIEPLVNLFRELRLLREAPSTIEVKELPAP